MCTRTSRDLIGFLQKDIEQLFCSSQWACSALTRWGPFLGDRTLFMTAELRKRPAPASSKSPQPAASSPAAADDDSKPPAGKRLPSVLRWAGIGLASLVIMAMGFYGYVKYRNGPYRHRDYDGDLLFTQDMLLEAKAKAANDKDAPIYLRYVWPKMMIKRTRWARGMIRALSHLGVRSIVGHVFDVSNGRHFYGPGGGYEFFTFRDGSRAFVTGKFDEVRGRGSHCSRLPPSCSPTCSWCG